MIIGENTQIEGSLDIWTSATITSGGIVSAADFRDYNFSGDRALISDSNKSIIESQVTTTEIESLVGVSANIQTQLSDLSGSNNLVNAVIKNPAGTQIVNVDSDNFLALSATSISNLALVIRTSAANATFTMKNDGAMEWGPGSSTRNTNLYYGGANTLKTDDNFIAVGNVSASGFYNTGFAGSKVVVSNASKALVESSISTTELGYLSSATSNIQTQLDDKIFSKPSSNSIGTVNQSPPPNVWYKLASWSQTPYQKTDLELYGWSVGRGQKKITVRASSMYEAATSAATFDLTVENNNDSLGQMTQGSQFLIGNSGNETQLWFYENNGGNKQLVFKLNQYTDKNRPITTFYNTSGVPSLTTSAYGKLYTGHFGDVYVVSANASTVPYLDANKKIVSSTVTPTELGYLSTTSANIQNQINYVTTTVQSNSADWESTVAYIGSVSAEVNNINVRFRENIAAGYSKLCTVSNTSPGHTVGILIDAYGYVTPVGDSRNGTFKIYFGVNQVQPMTSAAATPTLKVEGNDSNAWTFGYTIDTDTSATKTYTLWCQHPANYAYLAGNVRYQGRPVTVYENDVPTTIPAGYVAGTYSDKKLNSLLINSLSTSAVVVTDGSKNLVSSPITTTELGYLSTTSANIQTQLTTLSATKQNLLTNPVTGTGTNGYIPKFTGTSTIGNSIIQDSGTLVTIGGNLTATNISAATLTIGNISNTEFSYLDTVSANIQTQLNQLAVAAVSGSGAGTSNKITKFVTSSSMGDSSITDTGSLVTFSTQVTVPRINLPNNTQSLYVGDDASLGDVNYAHTIGIVSQSNASLGYVKFGSDTNTLGYDGNTLTYSGTAKISNVSATNISGTTITIGNVSNTEFGYLDTVSANIQTQLSNLSGTKVDKTTQVIAGTGLAGGGALTSNVTLSLATTGTAGTYTKVTTNTYGQVTAGTNITSADVPTLGPSKISQDASNRFVTDTQISNWNTAYTSAHFHSNKSNLDLINQNLATTASPSFNVLSASQLTINTNGAGTNINLGDDAYVGDINVQDTIGIKGISTPSAGYIRFGNATNSFGYNGTNLVYNGTIAQLNLAANGADIIHTSSTFPSFYIGQNMAANDYWRIYGEGTTNQGRLVIEVGDDGDEGNIVFRKRMAYAPYTTNDYTLWHTGSLTNLNQLTNGPGYITGNQTITISGDASGSGTTLISITNSKINVTEHSANNTEYPVVWDNNARQLYHTAAKITFNPSLGRLSAVSLAGPLTGNASTSTALQTARTLTIGSTGKTFNGTANVSWSLAEIGAASTSHTHTSILTNGASPTAATAPDSWSPTAGMYFSTVYNQDYPSSYGNVLSIRGTGGNQIFTGWAGTNGGSETMWFRNKRDAFNGWSSWQRVIDTVTDATSISNWNTAWNRVSLSNLAGDTYQNNDGDTWITRMANRGTHFGRITNTSNCPSWFSYLMLRESTGGDYSVIGCTTDGGGDWYVGRSASNAELTTYHKIWTTKDFNPGNYLPLTGTINGSTDYFAFSTDGSGETGALVLTLGDNNDGSESFRIQNSAGSWLANFFSNTDVSLADDRIKFRKSTSNIDIWNPQSGNYSFHLATTATTFDFYQGIPGNSSLNASIKGDGAATFSHITVNGETLNGDLIFSNITGGGRGIYGQVGTNDGWRIIGGAPSDNNGYLEIATTDDGNEPIYVRQYNNGGGWNNYSGSPRTLTLLDASGNTTIPGDLIFSNITGGGRGIYGQVGTNDGWRIIGGAPSDNNGYLEIATTDDGNEPIYVRQYNNGGGWNNYSGSPRTLTLLDASGNTTIPGSLTIGGGANKLITTVCNWEKYSGGPTNGAERIDIVNPNVGAYSDAFGIDFYYSGTQTSIAIGDPTGCCYKVSTVGSNINSVLTGPLTINGSITLNSFTGVLRADSGTVSVDSRSFTQGNGTAERIPRWISSIEIGDSSINETSTRLQFLNAKIMDLRSGRTNITQYTLSELPIGTLRYSVNGGGSIVSTYWAGTDSGNAPTILQQAGYGQIGFGSPIGNINGDLGTAYAKWDSTRLALDNSVTINNAEWISYKQTSLITTNATLNADITYYTISATANRTITLPASPRLGTIYYLNVIDEIYTYRLNPNSGNYILFRDMSDVSWRRGSVSQVPILRSGMHLVSCYYDGASYIWTLDGNHSQA